MTAATLKRTPLYDWHAHNGGRFVEFAGWEMPVLYTSIVEEHVAVRKQAGMFDISHMGQIFVNGADALAFLQKLSTNDVSKCALRQGMYSHFCNEQGGVIDDVFIYKLDDARYLVVVNASTTDKDFAWMQKHAFGDVRLENVSADVGMIALQGPNAEKIAAAVLPELPERLRCLEVRYRDRDALLCRTGYTGEDGFEFIVPNDQMLHAWTSFFQAGKDLGVKPCGLGARDTLRLEAGFLLYGNDMDEEHTSIESGPAWVVKFSKPDFIGRGPLFLQHNGALKRRLQAFKLLERGIPRHGSKIFCNGQPAGEVTSGTFSPMLQQGIALGYVPAQVTGTFAIECHGKQVPAVPAKPPFYKNS